MYCMVILARGALPLVFWFDQQCISIVVMYIETNQIITFTILHAVDCFRICNAVIACRSAVFTK
jgi:hypothetical protein